MTTADARRISQLTQQLHQEQTARRKAEQQLGGMKSAVVRLQAKLAGYEAKAAKAKAKDQRAS
jgi:hypothetical protein